MKAAQVPHAIVDSRQCITGRQLLEQTLAATGEAIDEYHGGQESARSLGRCESLSTLQVQLGILLAGNKRLVLVFDGIDRQREAPQTLIPALARFGELVCISTLAQNRIQMLIYTDTLPHYSFHPLCAESAPLPLHWHPTYPLPALYPRRVDPNTLFDAPQDLLRRTRPKD